MIDEDLRDFQASLDSVPDLPLNRSGRWSHETFSRWVDLGDDCGFARLFMRRTAEFADDNAPRVGYRIEIRTDDAVVSMAPESAIALARNLIAAGTAALRDLAINAAFLGQQRVPDCGDAA